MRTKWILSGIFLGISTALAQEATNPLCPALKALSDFFPMLKVVGVGGLAIIVLVVFIGAFATEKYRHGIVVLIAGSVGVIALWYVTNAIEPKVKDAADKCEAGNYTRIEQVWKG
ncbi:MAG TPA: hypothetical protein EYH58_00115 [Aquifex aeolicus]|nr:hypothetical protein [Aquifex aeolicus]